MILSIIAAADEDNVIGLGNMLPWNLPADLNYFREKTKGHPVIMGRKTFESIIERRGSPLPDRRSIVISESLKQKDRGHSLTQFDIDIVASFEDAVGLAKQIVDEPSCFTSDDKQRTPKQGEAFVIGGAQVYETAMPYADRIYLTRIHGRFDGDKFFPYIPSNDWEVISEKRCEPDAKNPVAYTFMVYARRPSL